VVVAESCFLEVNELTSIAQKSLPVTVTASNLANPRRAR